MSPSGDNIFLGSNNNLIIDALINVQDYKKQYTSFVEVENSKAETVYDIKYFEFFFSSIFDRSDHIHLNIENGQPKGFDKQGNNENSYETSSENLDYDENSVDLYWYASDKTVLLATSHEGEFISRAAGENFSTAYLVKTCFVKRLSTLTYFQLESLDFKLNEQYHFLQQNIQSVLFKLNSTKVLLKSYCRVVQRKITSKNVTAGINYYYYLELTSMKNKKFCS